MDQGKIKGLISAFQSIENQADNLLKDERQLEEKTDVITLRDEFNSYLKKLSKEVPDDNYEDIFSTNQEYGNVSKRILNNFIEWYTLDSKEVCIKIINSCRNIIKVLEEKVSPITKSKTKVFLSSVCKEFREERKTLKERIENYFGWDVYLSDDDNATSFKSSEEKLTQELENRQIFILLLGSEYGGDHPDGERSITEWEYDTACSLKMLKLAFRKADSKGNDKQEKFKNKVLHFNKGINVPEFESVQQLNEKVTEAINEIIDECVTSALPLLTEDCDRGDYFVKAEMLGTTGSYTHKTDEIIKAMISINNQDKEYAHQIKSMKLVYNNQEIDYSSYRDGYDGIPKHFNCQPLPIEKQSKKIIYVEFGIPLDMQENKKNLFGDIQNLNKKDNKVETPFKIRITTYP